MKLKGKQILLSKGYKEEKIKVDSFWFLEELNNQIFKFRIDVYGENGVKTVIECGNFPRWKWPFYEKHFGKENIIHLPYPKRYGKYLASEVEENKLSQQQAKQYLIDTYKKYVYGEFKNDPDYNFVEFREDNA